MRKSLVLLSLLLIFVLFNMQACVTCDNSLPFPPLSKPSFSEYLVKMKSDVLKAETVTMQMQTKHKVQAQYVRGLDIFKITQRDLQAFLKEFKEQIRYYEPNYIMTIDVPNDPYWEKQWNMKNFPGGVNAEGMWDNFDNPGQDQIVAVVDTGINREHEDLSNACIHQGKDFIDNDDNPVDGHGHGTHVSGTIAEVRNNMMGATGITQSCILPVRVLDEQGSGTLETVANGIRWACDNGANVVNLSLGASVSCEDTQTLQDAINFCTEKNAVVIAAAGNDNTEERHSPADCNHAISVAALTPNANRASYSNCGDWVKIAAPGGDKTDEDGNGEEDRIWQAALNNNYEGYMGTSMAAPHVSAAVAIALQMGIAPENMLAFLCSNSKPLEDDNIGCGALDLLKITTSN